MSGRSVRTGATLPNSSQAAANAALYWEGDHEALFADTKEPKSPWRVHHSPDSADMLSAMEDVWLRLANSNDVRFAGCWDRQARRYTVMFRALHVGPESPTKAQTQALLEVAGSDALYTWQENNQIYRLCSNVQWIGDTLVIELQPRERLQRALEGCDLVLRLEALLKRMATCQTLDR
jgi:hypothetical protein